eukprot:GHVS01070367.1.p1 GENE.GHVS01070367.1~~GHVS01070367.1.p1  ORF type:complete len:1088 (+),score=181.14 GHVS01070367.1:30-3293(+)
MGSNSISSADLQGMKDLLVGLMDPATASEATQQLKTVLAKPGALTVLLALMSNNDRPEIRQIAGVLLRRRVLKQWGQLPAVERELVKETLLSRLSVEQEHSVKLAVAHVISAVGKVEVDTWGVQLCQFMVRLSQDESPNNREAAVTVLTALIENTNDKLKKHFHLISGIFAKCLVDPSGMGMRMAALRGVQALSFAVDSSQSVGLVRPLLLPICQLVETAVDEDKDDVAELGLEILDDMMENSHVFQNSDIPQMVGLMLKIAGKTDLDCGLRDQALHFIHWVSKNKPKVLYKDGLVLKVLDAVIPIGAEEEPDDLDEDDLCGHRIASQCVDSLAINLPNRYIYTPVVERLRSYIHSDNPHMKKAALVFLGIMSEGCEAVMRTQLGEILPFVFRSFEDPSPHVRAAAATSFSQLAEYLQPEVFAYHEEAMKHLLQLIDCGHPAVQEKVCYALEVFCEELGSEEVSPYLPMLLPKLISTLKTDTTSNVRENCLGAIGAAAASADQQFKQYSEESLTLLKDILSHAGTQDDVVAVKAKAIECVGTVAKAIGAEHFGPCHVGFLQLICQNVDGIDRHDIRRSAFTFFGTLAESMGEKYVPYIEKTMIYIFASLYSSDGLEPVKAAGKEDAEDWNDMDSDDEDEDDDMDVRTGFLDEMESAMVCLQNLWDHITPQCMKYLQKTTSAIEMLHQHFSSDVRELSAGLMSSVLKGTHKQLPTGVTEFAPGLPVTTLFVHEHNMKLWNDMFWGQFKALLDDDDKDTVAGVASTLGDLIEELGPQLVEGRLDELVSFLVKILSNTHDCQKYTEIDEDEESRLEEEQLFDNISILIAGISKALGPQFVDTYSKLHPKLLALATHRQSTAYQSIGLGCASAAIHSMGRAAEPLIESLLPSVVAGLKQEADGDLRRNAAYAGGLFIEVSPTLAQSPDVVELLKLLHPILVWQRDDLTEKEHNIMDNAVAAVARVMLHCPNAMVSWGELLPLFFRQLPLVEDLEESTVVTQALAHVFETPEAQPILESNLAKFLSLTIQEATTEKTTIDRATRDKINAVNVAILKKLGPSHPVLQELLTMVSNKGKAEEYMQLIFNPPPAP